MFKILIINYLSHWHGNFNIVLKLNITAMNKVIITEGDSLCRLVNRRLTHKLIRLHAKGYELDFSLSKNNGVCCLQSGECFDVESLAVALIDQAYDFITNSYKYLHAVETACGKKGILLIEGIYHFHLKAAPIMLSLPSAYYQIA